MATGLWLRTYRLADNPVSLYWDEAAIGYDAYSLSLTGHDMHGQSGLQAIFPSYGDYKMPLYIWLTAFWVKLLGPTVTAIRLSSAVCGTLLIGVGYLLAVKIFQSKFAGLATALVIALSPWAIQFSRAGFEANAAVLALTLMVWMLYKSLERKVWLIGVAFMAAAAVYGYFAARFVIPPLVIAFGILQAGRATKNYWLGLIGAGLIYVCLTAPIYLSPYYRASSQFRLSTPSLLNTDNQVIEQNINRELAGNSLVARLSYHRHWLTARRLGINLAANLDWRYIFFEGDPNLRHGTGSSGLFFVTGMVFLGAGLWSGLKRQTKALLFLLCWWLIALIPASIPLTQPHALRSLNALPAAALIIGWGMKVMAENRNKGVRYTGWSLMMVTLVLFWGYWHDYWHHYPARSAQAWQYGYEQAAKFLGQDEWADRKVYVEPVDRMYLYFLLFNRIDPKLIQGQTQNFQVNSFDRYRFEVLDEAGLNDKLPGSIMLKGSVVPDYFQNGAQLVSVIFDYSRQPLFRVYEKI